MPDDYITIETTPEQPNDTFQRLLEAVAPLIDDAFQQGGFNDHDGACCENSHMVTIGHHMPGCPRIAAWERLRTVYTNATKE